MMSLRVQLMEILTQDEPSCPPSPFIAGENPETRPSHTPSHRCHGAFSPALECSFFHAEPHLHDSFIDSPSLQTSDAQTL